MEGLLHASPGSPELLCLRGNCLAAAGNNVGVRAENTVHAGLCMLQVLCGGLAVGAVTLCWPLIRHSGQQTTSHRGAYAVVGYDLQAFASFASALAADGGHLETLTSCGRLYKSCGLLVESVESYRAAHALQPESQDASRALAVVLTDLGAPL